MTKKLVLLLLAAVLVSACSSSPKKEEQTRELREEKHEELKRDYDVLDASSNGRPGWIEDAGVWAAQNGKDVAALYFYSYESEPKVSRQVACDIAKANTKSDIAGEIATFIDKVLGQTLEGKASIDENTPGAAGLKEFIDNTLVEKISSFVNGAAIQKTYWEKRKYLQDKGATKDYVAYSCGVLVSMPKKNLEEAIRKASTEVVKKTEDAEMKAKVQKALDKADENFVKARQGEI
jgi:hypothetical protein